jgi:hypothetical protein
MSTTLGDKARVSMEAALKVFRGHPPMTSDTFRGYMHWNKDWVGYILYRLVDDGFLRECRVTVPTRGRAFRECKGFELVQAGTSEETPA